MIQIVLVYCFLTKDFAYIWGLNSKIEGRVFSTFPAYAAYL